MQVRPKGASRAQAGARVEQRRESKATSWEVGGLHDGFSGRAEAFEARYGKIWSDRRVGKVIVQMRRHTASQQGAADEAADGAPFPRGRVFFVRDERGPRKARLGGWSRAGCPTGRVGARAQTQRGRARVCATGGVRRCELRRATQTRLIGPSRGGLEMRGRGTDEGGGIGIRL